MSLANVEEISVPSAPGGFVSALPPPSSGPVHFERIAVPGTTLLTSSRFAATFFRSGKRVSVLRKIFGSVIVKRVEVTLIVPKLSGIEVAVALVPSNLTAPSSYDDCRSLPSVDIKTSNDVTAVQYALDFAGSSIPGIEWDLVIEPIRYGHVAVLVAHNAKTTTSAADHAKICTVQAYLSVECCGQGYGADVGGTTI